MEMLLLLKVISVRRCGWFYEEVLTETYSTQVEVAYCGRGRKPLPKRVVNPSLKYAQVVKERKNGKIIQISTARAAPSYCLGR